MAKKNEVNKKKGSKKKEKLKAKDKQRLVLEDGLLLSQLIFQLQLLDRSPNTFGEAGRLTPSEIHMLTVIAGGSPEGMRMSELAQCLQVTKGAVSQLAAKLEKRGLIMRVADPADSRVILAKLLDLGTQACEVHGQLQQASYQKIRSELTEEELSGFEKGLQVLIRVLKDKPVQ